jgi:hypothetical protein
MENYSEEIQGRSSTMITYFDINRSYNQRVRQGLENSLDIPGVKTSRSMNEFYADEEDYKINEEAREQKETQQQIELFSPMPYMSDKSELLSLLMISQLVENLPLIIQLRNWKLVYTPVFHGTSLQTFMNSASLVGPTILVLKDASGCVFGGFASEPWSFRKLYYGTPECFLFTFKESSSARFFFPTYKNECYMIADYESISMGGGGSGAGLFISSDLMKGYSRRSDTYDNEVLSTSENFNIMNMELWGLV